MNLKRLSCLAMAFAMVACGPDDAGQPGTSSATETTSDTGGEELCGGQACAEDEACDMVGPDCEELTPEQSSCRYVAQDCLYEEDTWEPVCTCDGKVRPFDCGYFNATSLQNCDRIECGQQQTCEKATEYCEVTITGPWSADFACRPLAEACGNTPTCDCLGGETCGQQCKGDQESGFRLVCGSP